MTVIRSALLVAAVACGIPALAQHHHGPGGRQASQYAGQQSREVKALSEADIRDLREGAGMGFAKAAELNRYPGPTHALEHAAELQLDAAQREALAALVKHHKIEARRLGERVLGLEHELDALFASRTASAEAVDRVVAEWGAATAKLRGEHLRTHLETTALLTAEQVERYVRVRGY